ncbi:MAG: hypothetical protein EA340_04270 [Nitriliruptor sp.]|nr:MAG: hypothetical protein EA340_04270 [Nitriliruptor sp.]
MMVSSPNARDRPIVVGCDEVVLREGSVEDLRRCIDALYLADRFDGFVLTGAMRLAWARLLGVWAA